jgi:SAM-dependent methyltransferase
MNLGARVYDLFFGPILKAPRTWIVRDLLDHAAGPTLDLCCGTGVQAWMLSRAGRPTFGLDLSLDYLRYAASAHPRLPLVCADALTLPFRSRSFGAVVIAFALHDKSRAGRDKMMAEVRRILVPGGRIIFLDFERPWSRKSRMGHFLVTWVERLAGREHFLNGRKFLARGGLKAFLRGQGLKISRGRPIEIGSCALAAAAVSRRSSLRPAPPVPGRPRRPA